MKVTINTQSLVLGECLMIVAANAPAYTRTTTAFASFHVRYPLSSVQNPYSCLAGNYGAVVNQCGYQVGLMFDLPVDGSNTYAIAVQNFALGNGFLGGPTCYAWTYDGNGNGAEGTSGTFIPRGAQTLTFTTAVVSNTNEAIALLCDVPSGSGISSLSVSIPGNAAQFVSQSVPSGMAPGQAYAVSVTMRNTGETTWLPSTNYHLGSQDPQDSTTLYNMGIGSCRLDFACAARSGGCIQFYSDRS